MRDYKDCAIVNGQLQEESSLNKSDKLFMLPQKACQLHFSISVNKYQAFTIISDSP